MVTLSGETEVVLLDDDWFETGSQTLTAKSLIETTGATFVGAILPR